MLLPPSSVYFALERFKFPGYNWISVINHWLRYSMVLIRVNSHSNDWFSKFSSCINLPQHGWLQVRLCANWDYNDTCLSYSFSALFFPSLVEWLFYRIVRELKLVGVNSLVSQQVHLKLIVYMEANEYALNHRVLSKPSRQVLRSFMLPTLAEVSNSCFFFVI